MRIALAIVVAGCIGCGAAQHRPPTTGGIRGLARDHDSGEPVAKAQVAVRADGQVVPITSVTASNGGYHLDVLPPGRYSVTASFAGQIIDVEHVDIRAGATAVVDLMFTLGRPDPIAIDFGDPKLGEIDRYRPPTLAPGIAMIEGTINEAGTHERVVGAVVTASRDVDQQTLQTVSDDEGRYRFDSVLPGTYVVSAYYNVAGHGQIEARRSDIAVAGAEAVVVPLWVELSAQ